MASDFDVLVMGSGRVRGFETPRLAINGLIPTPMAINPMPSGAALAVHAAAGVTGG